MTESIGFLPTSGQQVALLGNEQTVSADKGAFGGMLTNLLGVETQQEVDMTYEDYTAAAQILIDMLALLQQLQGNGLTHMAPAESQELQQQIQLLQNVLQNESTPEIQESVPFQALEALYTTLESGSETVQNTTDIASRILHVLESLNPEQIRENVMPLIKNEMTSTDAPLQSMPLLRPAPDTEGLPNDVPVELTLTEQNANGSSLSFFSVDRNVSSANANTTPVINEEMPLGDTAQLLPEDVMITKVTVRETVTGIKEITMDLIPENLGRVHIEVSLENNAMRAVVKCENPATMRLFNDNVQLLENALKDHQITVDSFHFAFNDGKRQPSQQHEEPKRKKAHSFGFEEVRSLSADAAVSALRTVDLRL